MSNLQSTSQPAHKWLRDNIATALGLTTFNRILTGTDIPDDFVVVGTVKGLLQEWAGFGNGRRDERYLIPVKVRVAQAVAKPAAADVDTLYVDAWQYANGVAALLTAGLTVNGVAGDPTLGGNVVFAQFETAAELPPAVTNAGRIEVGVEFDISCRAQVVR